MGQRLDCRQGKTVIPAARRQQVLISIKKREDGLNLLFSVDRPSKAHCDRRRLPLVQGRTAITPKARGLKEGRRIEKQEGEP